jgi:deoxyribose-phosphate aldolase
VSAPSLQALLQTGVDRVSAEERAARFQRRSIKTTSKRAGLRLAIEMCDLTTLEGADTPERVRRLARRAIHPDPAHIATTPSVAALCVYPNLVKTAVEALEGSGVAVASVATGFPAGQTPFDARCEEVLRAVEDGATEIDMVISRNALLSGDEQAVVEEISAFKEACGAAHLKVILETGELGSYAQIRRAALLACEAGADFVKTSTGKVSPAATLPVTLVLCEAVRDYERASGRKVGVKPAGGIRSAKQALHYLVMVQETLGPEYLTPELFRFGASSLLTDLLRQLRKLESGVYQGEEYFAND